jgi:hypothetical protein
MSYPPDFALFRPDVPNSGVHVGGPANGTTIHGNGSWIQHPANLDDQWALFCHYGSLRPTESYWLAPGAMVLVTPAGQRRILGHPYNTTGNYTFFTFAKFSSDGRYVLFTSDMNGSARSDVFLAEVPQPPSAPGTDLIVHLKLDEGRGMVANDASGTRHQGRLINGASWGAGRSGQAVVLDGVDGLVRVSLAPVLNAYPLTVAAWFKTTTATGVEGLVNKYAGSSYNGYQMFFNNGSLCAWYLRDTSNFVYDGGGCTLATPGYNDGAWHQAVFVVDAAGGRLYVHGVQTPSRGWTGTAGPPTTLRGISVGFSPGAAGGGGYLAGSVDGVRVYRRALGPGEVQQLYAGEP